MSELLGVTTSWPQALLEEAKLGVDALPRWAQRELRSTRAVEPGASCKDAVKNSQTCQRGADLHSAQMPRSDCAVGLLVKAERSWAPSRDLRLLPVVGDDSDLATQVRSLGEEEFREDALEIVETGGLWKATALVDGTGLVGFVVYGVLAGSMSLRYIAIVPEQRGKGHGRRLVNHVCRCCREQGVHQLTLFSKRELVAFYKAVGFCEVPDEDGDSEDDLQVPLVMSSRQLAMVAEGPKLLEEESLSTKGVVPTLGYAVFQ
mmetsp:Transcript_9641/g.17898  ORF Transcript_9641/g.17898 Transcript_9641/m.17898 type:complete len:261 (-) Transcript_9641:93-875(-)